MNCRFLSYVTTSALAALLYLASIPAKAQTTGAAVSAASGATDTAMHSAATPRTADGKPDLSGLWGPVNRFHMIVQKDANGRTTKLLYPEPDADEAKGDAELQAKRASDPNQPPYKHELLAKVKNLDENTNEMDGALHCKPPGVPRIGPPQQIIQTPGQVAFLYDLASVSNISGNYFRVMPTDGRPHRTDLDPSYLGDSVAHWEEDMLVVDVVGFNDLTWFGAGGRFHSEAMHVIERFTRNGDLLKYEVTVEDPNVLTKPWTMNPRLLKIDPTIVMSGDDAPCVDQDMPHMVTKEHH